MLNNVKKRLILYHPRYKFISALPQGSKVLDLGCGSCDAMNKFRGMRPDLVFAAVDIKDVKNSIPEGIEFHSVDIQSTPLPFKENSFDAIYCSHVLEHLYSTHLIAREITRVLKRGGQIYIETPSTRSLRVPSFKYCHEQGVPLNFYDDPTHIKPFSKTGLFIFLRNIGFGKIKIGTARNPWSLLLSPFFFLAGLIFKNRLWLTLPVWEVTGWCIYGLGSDLKKRS
jgi:SAM-dependent methyltransferase